MPLDRLTLAFSWASIDTEQQHAKREWIKNKDGEFVSRVRGKPPCQKPAKVDAQTKHAPAPDQGWDELFTERLERSATVKDIIMNGNRWFTFPDKRPWKWMKSKWENVIKQKRKAGCKTGRQPGGECKVKVCPTTRKRKKEVSNTRRMWKTKEARRLWLGPTQKNYERKMNKAWGAGRERSHLFVLGREKEFRWPVTN